MQGLCGKGGPNIPLTLCPTQSLTLSAGKGSGCPHTLSRKGAPHSASHTCTLCMRESGIKGPPCTLSAGKGSDESHAHLLLPCTLGRKGVQHGRCVLHSPSHTLNMWDRGSHEELEPPHHISGNESHFLCMQERGPTLCATLAPHSLRGEWSHT